MKERAVIELAAEVWTEVEIELEAASDWASPYLEGELEAEFCLEGANEVIRRPGFWSGGRIWKVRFVAPGRTGRWTWRTWATNGDAGLEATGVIHVRPARADGTQWAHHGFWRMDASARNLEHADGTPVLIVGDTWWALPWRATEEQCLRLCGNRAAQGFNAALLMVVQPDMRAEGPEERTQTDGFARGFADLPQGTLQQLNPDYFDHLDRLTAIMVDHGIVPIYQPVFHGFGWKGLDVAGVVVSNADMERFCRYLVARYGARPAIWLVGGDGLGTHPNVEAAGKTVHALDAYAQPTGIHYAPHASHREHQDAEWLDFQWCQTGHGGEHMPERVAAMWEQKPAKGVANGEPTYEHISRLGNANGWWQGHEAWSNLCAGGTMGVFYGAGSLWQMKLNREEKHPAWCEAPGFDWSDALQFEGARYVGLVGQILRDYPFAGMEPNWSYTFGKRGLAVPGSLFVLFLENGGDALLSPLADDAVPLRWTAYDPTTGEVIDAGHRKPSQRTVGLPGGRPIVLIFGDKRTA